ncbi:hypothetical protein POM88_045029 [Heracleum sosnowskyi]|uniref:Helitron helicase-like domain-containing protein n=1 Tax=Heracleum sosnowskyi TaxID=360622 RepID=A0AAD8M3F1_9APIA|nr:hypothetical protein POM88_045029 [Heracleum sosnowskyi]
MIRPSERFTMHLGGRLWQQFVVDAFAAVEQCIGVMHVIEFQKRGLPHVHMLVWLHPNDRPKRVEHVDQIVSAEIPDKQKDPVAYEVVQNYMMHGPCGKDRENSPCMVKGNCVRHFPKRYNGHTFFDDQGFPVYLHIQQKSSAMVGAVTGAALALTSDDSSHEQIVQCAITGAAML